MVESERVALLYVVYLGKVPLDVHPFFSNCTVAAQLSAAAWLFMHFSVFNVRGIFGQHSVRRASVPVP
jgi:hypothetical protein